MIIDIARTRTLLEDVLELAFESPLTQLSVRTSEHRTPVVTLGQSLDSSFDPALTISVDHRSQLVMTAEPLTSPETLTDLDEMRTAIEPLRAAASDLSIAATAWSAERNHALTALETILQDIEIEEGMRERTRGQSLAWLTVDHRATHYVAYFTPSDPETGSIVLHRTVTEIIQHPYDMTDDTTTRQTQLRIRTPEFDAERRQTHEDVVRTILDAFKQGRKQGREQH